MFRRERKFCSYSAVTRQGKRFQGVWKTLSKIKSAYSKPETKTRFWPVPVPVMRVALVMGLPLRVTSAAITGLGSGLPAAGVLGCRMQFFVDPLAQRPTGKEAWAISSAPFQFKMVNEGVEVHQLTGASFTPKVAPSALESTPRLGGTADKDPPGTSLKSNSIPCRYTFLKNEFLKSKEALSVKPSGLRSES